MPFENWEADQKISRTTLIIIATIAAASLIIGASAIYQITSPPSDPVTSNVIATLSKPATNATSVTVGQTVQITTKLSDGLDGIQVWFLENEQQIGSAYTDSTGTAIYNRVIPSTGTFVYKAQCTHP